MTAMKDGRRGLPRRPFFYTLDQVAEMMNLSLEDFNRSYVWRVSKELGAWRPRYIRAVNIAPRNTEALSDWRIGEAELLRWLRYTNLYVYDPFLGTDMLTDEEVESIDPPDPSLDDDAQPDAELRKL